MKTIQTKSKSTLPYSFKVFYNPSISTGNNPSFFKFWYAPSQVYSFEAKTPDEEGPRSIWKNFQHYSRKFEPKVVGSFKTHIVNGGFPDNSPQTFTVYIGRPIKDPYFWWWDGQGPIGEFAPWRRFTDQLYVPSQPDVGFVPKPGLLGHLNQRALNAMIPGIKTEVSLINSLLELKDFKSLPRTLKGFSKLPDVLKKASGAKTLRQLLQVGADAYLQYKFNISPLISDIMGIHRALSSTKDRINRLIRESEKVRLTHFSTSFKEFEGDHWRRAYDIGPIVGNDYWFPYHVGHIIEASCEYDDTLFHAEMEYNYTYSRFQTEHAQLLALLDSLGVNLNPSIIWNAIPWTFVIDWVINVSRWLDQFKLRNMEPVINIRKYLWSVKRTRRIHSGFKPGDGGAVLNFSQPKYTMPVVVESSFRRDAKLPSSSSLVTSGLNLGEFSLGVALVLSRRRRRKPKKQILQKDPFTWDHFDQSLL